MSAALVGAAIAFAICGLIDLRRHGWLPVDAPPKATTGSFLPWLIDRTYLIYAGLTVVAVIAAFLIPRSG